VAGHGTVPSDEQPGEPSGSEGALPADAAPRGGAPEHASEHAPQHAPQEAAEAAPEFAPDPTVAPNPTTAVEAVPDAAREAAVPEGAPSADQAAPGAPAVAAPVPPAPHVPPVPSVVEITDIDWDSVVAAVRPAAVRARARETVEQLEAILDRVDGPGLLFDDQRATPDDRAIHVTALDGTAPLWFVGDLHGDLLALEAALALIARDAAGGPAPRIVFLGDLFDDGGFGLEVVLRVYELIAADPGSVCLLTGNHDEALSFDGARFGASVSPSDFSEALNEQLAHEWVVRAGKVAVRLFADAPRALFFPDGLLAAHGGFPLVDLHAALRATGDFNHPACLTDFVWTRAHPRARKKLPNRVSRGSQFGYEDFAAFCAVSAELGRCVTHMVRGHDHVEERYAIYPAYAAHPVLTTVALSRRLAREAFGPPARVPTIARWVPGALPQVHRLHLPPALVAAVFPEAMDGDAVVGATPP
jgi:hypothetical protein